MLTRIEPPDDLTAESWLSQYDSQPTCFPGGMPESDRMVWIVVIDAEHGTDSFVLLTPRDLEEAMSPEFQGAARRLFFQVPKSILDGQAMAPG